MSTKKASKSRTSSKKSKKSLKVWYIIPVLLIVAVAGYAIVRYSNASAYKGLRTVTGSNKMVGYASVVDKQGQNGRSAVVGDGPVYASWTENELGNLAYNKVLCADVFVSGQKGAPVGTGGKGHFKVEVKEGGSAKVNNTKGGRQTNQTATGETSEDIYFSGEGYKTACYNTTSMYYVYYDNSVKPAQYGIALKDQYGIKDGRFDNLTGLVYKDGGYVSVVRMYYKDGAKNTGILQVKPNGTL